MIGTSPPGPLRCGSTTWRRKPAAAAASNAFPPPSSTLMPAADASQWVEATMPKSPFSSREAGRRDKRLRRLAEVIEDAIKRGPRERGHLVPQLRGRHGPLWRAQGRLDSGLEPVSPRQAGLRLQ